MEKPSEPLLPDARRIRRYGMTVTSVSTRRLLFFATLGALIVFCFYLHTKYSAQIYGDVDITASTVPATPLPHSPGLCAPVVATNGQIQVEKAVCAQTRVSMDELRAANSDALPDVKFTPQQQSSFCSGDGTDCVAEFKHMPTDDFVYAERDTQTLICTMPKNLSVLLGGLFCLLHDPIGYLYEGLDMFQQAFLSRLCHKRLYNSVDEAILKHNATMERDWDYLTVVREPVDRFISAFLYTCVHGAAAQAETKCIHFCYNCGYNFTCYVERSYARLMSLSKGEDTPMTFELHHIYPQTWRCDLEHQKSNFTIMKYETDSEKMINQLVGYFQRRGAPLEALSYVMSEATKQRTHHSTINSEHRPFIEQRLQSPYLMEKIIRMYYHDFKHFDYQIPNIAGN